MGTAETRLGSLSACQVQNFGRIALREGAGGGLRCRHPRPGMLVVDVDIGTRCKVTEGDVGMAPAERRRLVLPGAWEGGRHGVNVRMPAHGVTRSADVAGTRPLHSGLSPFRGSPM